MQQFFSFKAYHYIYESFTLLVLFVLYLDLRFLNRKPKEVSVSSSLKGSLFWVAFGLGINLLFYYFAQSELLNKGIGDAALIAKNLSFEFLTGYIIELALSVDNLFVFAVIFSYFQVPAQFQYKVLFYGILGALFFRGLFIGLGALVIHLHWVVVVLGVFLAFTGVKLFFSGDSEIEPEKNPVIKFLRKKDLVSNTMIFDRFFVKENGTLLVTPLFVCLIFVEITDIVFAVDSVPAIFAVTKEPLIVFLSNVCAILGLRSLYFLLASALKYFEYLKYGLSLILVFIGVKMSILEVFFNIKIDSLYSLLVILSILILSMISSVIFKKKQEV